tara:strand:- start:78 stop:332 length:255 start_codon:yes stop_codon:yes gene_type:complete
MNYHPLNLPIEEGRLTDDINAPTSRRDLNRIENVAWCIRNLAINNADHPMLKPTLEHLKRMISAHRKIQEIDKQWDKIQSIKLP